MSDCAGGCRSSRRDEINASSVETLTPECSISIISSRLNPACSPAIASLLIAINNFGLLILTLTELTSVQDTRD